MDIFSVFTLLGGLAFFLYGMNQLSHITGGGGCLIRNFSKGSLERIKFIDDICAAAKGYEYMAELQMRRQVMS